MTEPLPQHARRQTIIATLLMVCVLVVAFWEIMSSRNQGPSANFELTHDDLRDVRPVSEVWTIRSFPVRTTAMEPNIAAYLLEDSGADTGMAYLVRLVHGYNMCDCMRIKGYTVELVEDRRAHGSRRENGAMDVRSSPDAPGTGPPLQLWRLTSSNGDVSIWVTSMLRTGTFAATHEDVRSMAFPRIGIPDDPRWVPRGFTVGSLRHPIRNVRMMLRAKWNNSRADWLTFLGLRRPAWASEELLTLVTASRGGAVKPEEEARIIDETVAAHTFMLRELQAWRSGGSER